MKDAGVGVRRFKVRIPRLGPITPEELERRAKAVDRILELRRKIGPITASAEELIREAREDESRV